MGKEKIPSSANAGTSSENSLNENLSLFDNNIPQNENKGKQKKSTVKNKGLPCKLSMASATYSLATKFYAEQLTVTEEELWKRIESLDKKEFFVVAIKHDMDETTDGIWEIAKEKPHFHIIIRETDKKKKFRIRPMLEKLGIVFRRDLDDTLLKNRGIETVGNFARYTTYLTHETEDAIADGKYVYARSCLHSNLTEPELEEIRAGYVKPSELRRLTADELAMIDREAFDLGYAMKDFSAWYNELPFNLRAHTKMRTIRESYARGVDKRLNENTEIMRVCIFIQGEPNTGKTYTAKQVVEQQGLSYLSVGGGGSGKCDKLQPHHQCIIVDDDVFPNLLNMSDNYICRAYRRNKDNPAWAGNLLIITSNLTFEEYLKTCGFKTRDLFEQPTKHLLAMESRFFICEMVEKNGCLHLRCKTASTRGSIEEQKKRAEIFRTFWTVFNEKIKDFKPTKKETLSFDFLEPDEEDGEQGQEEAKELSDAELKELEDIEFPF